MVRAALIGIPLVLAVAAMALAALLLPACALGGLTWAQACPPAADAAAPDRQAALAARRAALESEIAALQRRVAAIPPCPRVAAAPPAPPAEPPPEPPPEVAQQTPPPPEVVPTPRPERRPEPPREIDEERWRDRDVSLLEGCWNLDSDYRLQDRQTGVINRVRTWQMCFDANGRGRQTLVFTDGTRCESPVSGRFAGSGSLQIDDGDDVACTNGSSIFRRESTCTLNGRGGADCQSRQRAIGGGTARFTLRR